MAPIAGPLDLVLLGSSWSLRPCPKSCQHLRPPSPEPPPPWPGSCERRPPAWKGGTKSWFLFGRHWRKLPRELAEKHVDERLGVSQGQCFNPPVLCLFFVFTEQTTSSLGLKRHVRQANCNQDEFGKRNKSIHNAEFETRFLRIEKPCVSTKPTRAKGSSPL